MDGTRHLFRPLTLLETRGADSGPRINLVVYHGVLAPTRLAGPGVGRGAAGGRKPVRGAADTSSQHLATGHGLRQCGGLDLTCWRAAAAGGGS
jgi:hypothetical protein